MTLRSHSAQDAPSAPMTIMPSALSDVMPTSRKTAVPMYAPMMPTAICASVPLSQQYAIRADRYPASTPDTINQSIASPPFVKKSLCTVCAGSRRIIAMKRRFSNDTA